jgi:hypothetical protein
MSLFDDAKLILTPNGYKSGKAYSLKPFDGTGDFGVVRATTATRVNSAGLIESVAANVPRINYPIGGGCPHWLVEGQDTNEAERSEELDNAYWIKTRLSITANDTIAPDGELTAEKLVADTDNNTHFIVKGGFAASNEYKVFSLFLKAAEFNSAQVVLRGASAFSNRVEIRFNISDGTVYSQGAFGTFSGFDSRIEEYENGWYKLELKGFVPSTETNVLIQLLIGNNNTFSFAGDGTSGVHAWGLGLTNDFGSYIPTVATTVTRNADVITVAPPAGTTEIVEYFADNTTNTETVIPVTYQLPNAEIEKVIMT